MKGNKKANRSASGTIAAFAHEKYEKGSDGSAAETEVRTANHKYHVPGMQESREFRVSRPFLQEEKV